MRNHLLVATLLGAAAILLGTHAIRDIPTSPPTGQVAAPPVEAPAPVPAPPRINPDIVAGIIPDPTLTPGRTRPDATLAQLCDKTFRTGRVRNVSGALKEDVRQRYGMTSKRDKWCNTEEMCEIDHLIPLVMGGSNDIENLWPQPYEGEWNAHHKDQLEVRMKRLVCKGNVSLEEAQNVFRGDWREGYRRYIAPQPKKRGLPRGSID